MDESSTQPKLPQLVKDVVEREISTDIPLPPSAFGNTFDAPSPTGFPIATKSTLPPRQSVPTPATQKSPETEITSQDSLPNLLSSVSNENERVVANMSDSAIAEAQRQIREEMGLSAGVLAMLEDRARKKRAAAVGVPIVPGSSFPHEEEGTPITVDEEEGSPEYIRRKFFPTEPPAAENTSLDWMRPGPSLSTAPALPTFDLNGLLLPPSTSTHSHSHGTHEHHVSSSSTFTIPSLLSLVNSNVSAQRSTAYQIISRILLQPELEKSIGKKYWESLRVEATRGAGWGVRDKNMGVASSAIVVLDIIFVQEQREGRRSNGKKAEVVEGKFAIETVVEVFLAMDPFPSFARHLQFASLPPHSLDAIVRILHNIVLHSAGGPKSLAVEELVACKGLLEAISKRCIGVAWPPAPSSSDESIILPSLEALSFFILLAQSSRERARAIWSRRIATPLQFLSTLPWSFVEGSELRKLGYALLESTLELWIVLGRYGIGTTLRTSAADLLSPLFDHFDDVFDLDSSTELVPETTRLAEKWFALLTIWTTTAIDPHSTEHDIVWTQVDWSVHAAEAHKYMMAEGVNGREGLMASIWELLAVWLEGSKVNNAWKGEEERKWLMENVGEDFSTNGPANIVCDQALEAFSGTSDAAEPVAASHLLVSAIRLSSAYAESTSPVTLPFLKLDQGLVRDSFRRLPTIVAATTSWSVVRLFVALLPFVESLQERLDATFNVITLLGSGDEVTARELTNWVMTNAGGASKADIDEKLERPSLLQAPILKPFVLHAIITASRAQLASPLYPTSKDIVLTTSQRPFCEIGSLLQPDWPLFVLNELLKSGSSQVFENLPPGWDASELDLVKTSLALMRIISVDSPASTSPSLLIYDLIKVFMLEKDNSERSNEQISDVDLFRHESVQHSMSLLLQPLRMSSQPPQLRQIDDRPSESTLEGVSSLVSSAPFYRLYTDLLGLYEAISLSHPLFSQILLPPLSTIYPIDYRKLLWTDYSHILKSIRIDVGEAISDRQGVGALAGYLFPVEGNDGMLGAYADALISGKVSKESNGFLYFVALHHVAATIFGGTGSTIARKLAGAMMSQGSDELMRDVLRLSIAQKEGEEVLLPPACFVESLEGERAEVMRGLLDGEALEKFNRRSL